MSNRDSIVVANGVSKSLSVVRKELVERNDHIREFGYFNVDSIEEFFKLLFERDGELNLQELGHEHFYDRHYNAVVLTMDKKKRVKQYVITRDLLNLKEIRNAEFAITAPMTYVGRRRTLKAARLCYGFAFDLDGVELKNLDELHYQIYKMKVLPQPSLVVSSGTGIHLYYLFHKPVQMFERNIKLLERLKHCMTSRLWTKVTSTLEKPQFQGLDQGYRIPFTKTKFDRLVLGFRKEKVPYYTVSELNKFMRNFNKVVLADKPLTDEELIQIEGSSFVPSKVSLKVAKERYPEWYEKRIVRGDTSRGCWYIKEDLYNWWLETCRTSREVSVGHRYFCVMCLATYASKCHIPYERLKEDAHSLIERMQELTNDPENPFTEEDIKDALKAYTDSYRTFPRKTISLLSGIDIPANKRNYRKQAKHLAIARQAQAIDWEDKDGNWYDGNGRKIKADQVFWWRQKNPLYIDGIYHPENNNKARCIRETAYEGYKTVMGIDEKTGQPKKIKQKVTHHLSSASVAKWWNALPDNLDNVGFHEMIIWVENHEKMSEEEKLEFLKGDFFKEYFFNGSGIVTPHDSDILKMIFGNEKLSEISNAFTETQENND